MHKRIYDKTAVDDLVLLTDISEDGIVANLRSAARQGPHLHAIEPGAALGQPVQGD